MNTERPELIYWPDDADNTGKGKDNSPGIFRAAEQYGVRDAILDCMTFDITKSPWRRGGWLDAVITDPPCMYIYSAPACQSGS